MSMPTFNSVFTDDERERIVAEIHRRPGLVIDENWFHQAGNGEFWRTILDSFGMPDLAARARHELHGNAATDRFNRDVRATAPFGKV